MATSTTSRPKVLRPLGSTAVWLFVAFCLFAFVFMLMSSFKNSSEILNTPWSLPTSLDFGNWGRAWTDSGFGEAAVNTVLLVVTASVVVVGVSAPAAYALSRRTGRLSGGITMLFVIGLGIPLQVIVLPLYSVLAELGLIDSLFGLFLVYVATHLPFTVFLLTGFFRSLPNELEEAAALDGVSATGTFFRIMLPLARGGLVTALLLNAIGLWNETLLGLMFIQSTEKYTLSLALIGFIQQQQYSGADYGALFAGVSITIIPMLLLYLWLGRRITEGLTAGLGK
ncbi:MAG TPA: carbohydrate ABC transporter permease [Actinokineospora sp.]|jgi:multiple sugar transport system permease protein/N-acetylglucosamine transport system permease protein|nr:carbohydrate ABC transporter permease [Actinokineospora sp.]